MSNELTLLRQFRLRKGNVHFDIAQESRQVDVAGTGRVSLVQTIGFAAHEALVVTDLATAGYADFENLDDTNYVQLGIDVSGTFYPFGKLMPGEWGQMPLAGLAVYAKANVGAVRLSYTIIDR